jgi:hypothetical protein
MQHVSHTGHRFAHLLEIPQIAFDNINLRFNIPQILAPTSGEIVEHADALAVASEPLDEVRPDKSRAARD